MEIKSSKHDRRIFLQSIVSSRSSTQLKYMLYVDGVEMAQKYVLKWNRKTYHHFDHHDIDAGILKASVLPKLIFRIKFWKLNQTKVVLTFVFASVNFQKFRHINFCPNDIYLFTYLHRVGNTERRGISISSQPVPKKNLYYSTRHYLLKKVKDIFHLLETMMVSEWIKDARSMSKCKFEMTFRLSFSTSIAHFFDDDIM